MLLPSCMQHHNQYHLGLCSYSEIVNVTKIVCHLAKRRQTETNIRHYQLPLMENYHVCFVLFYYISYPGFPKARQEIVLLNQNSYIYD